MEVVQGPSSRSRFWDSRSSVRLSRLLRAVGSMVEIRFSDRSKVASFRIPKHEVTLSICILYREGMTNYEREKRGKGRKMNEKRKAEKNWRKRGRRQKWRMGEYGEREKDDKN